MTYNQNCKALLYNNESSEKYIKSNMLDSPDMSNSYSNIEIHKLRK
jgi:hypothetical protein